MLVDASNNLAKDPLMFPPCGHAAKMSVLDQRVGGINSENTSPLHTVEKGCPTCDQPLDIIMRYSHKTKSTRLNNSAKKIHMLASTNNKELDARLESEIESLRSSVDIAVIPSAEICLDGDPSKQIQTIIELDVSMNTHRYARIYQVRIGAQRYVPVLQEMERPFAEMREHAEAQSKKGEKSHVDLVASIPRVEGLSLMGVVLLAQCDLAILTDVIHRVERKHHHDESSSLSVDFQANRERCVRLIDEAHNAKMCKIEVQGHMFWALYASLECRITGPSIDTQYLEVEANGHLAEAYRLCDAFSLQTGILMVIDADLPASLSAARRGEPFDISDKVSIDGLPSPESVKGGAWYKCINGHPFVTNKGTTPEYATCYYCGEGLFNKTEAEDGGKEEEVAGGVVVKEGEDLIGL